MTTGIRYLAVERRPYTRSWRQSRSGIDILQERPVAPLLYPLHLLCHRGLEVDHHPRSASRSAVFGQQTRRPPPVASTTVQP